MRNIKYKYYMWKTSRAKDAKLKSHYKHMAKRALFAKHEVVEIPRNELIVNTLIFGASAVVLGVVAGGELGLGQANSIIKDNLKEKAEQTVAICEADVATRCYVEWQSDRGVIYDYEVIAKDDER